MYSFITPECARERIADLHRQAERDARARTARRARRASQPRPQHRKPAVWPIAFHKVLAVLGARSR